MRYNLYLYCDYKTFIRNIFEYLCTILKRIIGQIRANIQADLSGQVENQITEGFSRERPSERALFNLNFTFLSALNEIEYEQNGKDNSKAGNIEQNLKKNDMQNFTRTILSIFHNYADLREFYLTTNLVEKFHFEIFQKYEQSSRFDMESLLELSKLVKTDTYFDCIPNTTGFKNLLEYEVLNMTKMYDEFKKNHISSKEPEEFRSKANFVHMLIELFNICGTNSYNKQLCITLIARVTNEKAEFIRSIDRSVLIFNNTENLIYEWVNQSNQKFKNACEEFSKAIDSAEVKQNNTIDDSWDYDPDDTKIALEKITKILISMYYCINHECEFEEDSERNEVLMVHSGTFKINRYTQVVFRNQKVYDELLNFYFKNKNYLLECYDARVGKGKGHPSVFL